MITGSQVRAARGMLNISAKQLAEYSKVGVATIRRMELTEGVPSSNAQTLDDVRKTLEMLGVQFVGSPEDCPGVRLVKPKA